MMEPSEKREWLRKDRQSVWHPFTQMKDYAERDPILVEKAEGVFLYDADGNRYYDTNSSWWINVHGHGHPRIKAAIAAQLDRFDQVMFSGMTHRPGIELADKLVAITPPGLDKVFYSDNGSTAVEVALKMSFQYWQQRGVKTKTKFVFLDNSYHGDTLGAVSVGGVDAFHSVFRPLLFSAFAVPAPNAHSLPDQSEAAIRAHADDCLAAVRHRLESSADEIAALIVEPMIQAAGGMIMHPAYYVRELRALCSQFGVHLIADEVAVGFGRTGRMFACEHAGITPDFMCLSKGLTAGIMPLSATLCTNDVYDAFYDDYESHKMFTHGHSFTGNPVAAAVALESLRIFADERVLERSQASAARLQQEAQSFAELAHVGRVRSLGMVAAFELLRDKATGEPYPPAARMGFRVFEQGLKHGLLLRPLGDTLYYWLPLCTTEAQIADIAQRTRNVLRELELA